MNSWRHQITGRLGRQKCGESPLREVFSDTWPTNTTLVFTTALFAPPPTPLKVKISSGPWLESKTYPPADLLYLNRLAITLDPPSPLGCSCTPKSHLSSPAAQGPCYTLCVRYNLHNYFLIFLSSVTCRQGRAHMKRKTMTSRHILLLYFANSLVPPLPGWR